jgi:hypothetical protein
MAKKNNRSTELNGSRKTRSRDTNHGQQADESKGLSNCHDLTVGKSAGDPHSAESSENRGQCLPSEAELYEVVTKSWKGNADTSIANINSVTEALLDRKLSIVDGRRFRLNFGTHHPGTTPRASGG